MIRTFSSFLVAVCVINGGAPARQAPPPAAPPSDAEMAREADRLFSGYQETGLFSGAVLIARGDRVLYQNAAGLANPDFEVANTVKTQFRIGCISSLFTAAAVLRLQEQGKLNVIDPVGKHMPAWPDAYHPITIHQLLVGGAGVKDVTQIPEFVRTVAAPRSTQELAAVVLNEPWTEPGAAARRGGPANSEYHLLAAIVERVGGLSFTEYIRREITARAGLDRTGHDNPREVVGHRAAGLSWTPQGVRQAGWFHMDNAVGMANLISTVGDVHRFVRAVATGKVVSKESLAQMATAHVPSRELPGGLRTPGGGYGLMLNQVGRGKSTSWFSGCSIGGFLFESAVLARRREPVRHAEQPARLGRLRRHGQWPHGGPSGPKPSRAREADGRGPAPGVSRRARRRMGV